MSFVRTVMALTRATVLAGCAGMSARITRDMAW